MSPRAAWRLESMGFKEVYDYGAGEADWAAAGLPVEGAVAAVPTAGAEARKDVPTADLSETVGDVKSRLGDWDTAMVVNHEKVVLGRLYKRQLEGDQSAKVEDVMVRGPSTFRPNVSIPEMVEFMSNHDLKTAPITTSEGVLVGILYREDAEKVMHQLHEHHA